MRVSAAKSAVAFWAVLVAPVAFAVLFVGGLVLRENSAINFAANFTDSRRLVASTGDIAFGVTAVGNRLGLVYAGPSRYPVFQLKSVTGKAESPARRLDYSTEDSQETVTTVGGKVFVAWINPVGQTGSRLVVRQVWPSFGRRIVVTPASTVVEHPTIFAAPSGRVDVAFSWQRQLNADIYLASVSIQSQRLVFVRRLVRARAYAFFPRVAVDGRGNLDLLYMDFCCRGTDWQILSRRFSPWGRPLGHSRWLAYVPELGSPQLGLPPLIPSQWGLDATADGRGGVWGAWQSGDIVSLIHWDRNGHRSSTSQIFTGVLDNRLATMSLNAGPGGGWAYASTDAAGQSTLTGFQFGSRGQSLKAERAEYTTSASVQNPTALDVGARHLLLWSQTNDSGVISSIQASALRPAVGPPLAAQLGINVGNMWLDILLLFGTAAIGACFVTIVNALVVLPLILAWYPVAKIPQKALRWPVYLALLAVVSVAGFAVRSPFSKAILLIPTFPSPYGWWVVIGALATGYWIGWRTLANEEAIFRAATTTISAIYFVAFMWVLGTVEAAIGQI